MTAWKVPSKLNYRKQTRASMNWSVDVDAKRKYVSECVWCKYTNLTKLAIMHLFSLPLCTLIAHVDSFSLLFISLFAFQVCRSVVYSCCEFYESRSETALTSMCVRAA